MKVIIICAIAVHAILASPLLKHRYSSSWDASNYDLVDIRSALDADDVYGLVKRIERRPVIERRFVIAVQPRWEEEQDEEDDDDDDDNQWIDERRELREIAETIRAIRHSDSPVIRRNRKTPRPAHRVEVETIRAEQECEKSVVDEKTPEPQVIKIQIEGPKALPPQTINIHVEKVGNDEPLPASKPQVIHFQIESSRVNERQVETKSEPERQPETEQTNLFEPVVDETSQPEPSQFQSQDIVNGIPQQPQPRQQQVLIAPSPFQPQQQQQQQDRREIVRRRVGNNDESNENDDSYESGSNSSDD